MNKSWKITINQNPLTLTLTPPPQWGYCFKCQEQKPIRIISEHPLTINDNAQIPEVRKFCQSCALENLNRLEWGDYKVDPKIIQEVRSNLVKYV
jgi:hypothetical protein